MKKVININFQGRVVPIEETAYEMLQQYVDSLRRYFANEEGKDEIINDIESRIAELFAEVLKKGSTCISDVDVNNIIASMGRPEDFDGEEENVKTQLGGNTQQQQTNTQFIYGDTRKLFRDENHKILGGVCSGIANYFGIDPIIIRIIAILTFGIVFIPYLILWVAVPSSASQVIGSTRKRLFRDPDNKIIAGVCGGLASYFGVNVWIPRVLFLIPFISFVFKWSHWGWFDFPHFVNLSFSPGATIIYIILWLILPEAITAAEKLEMKGERVDVNSIKNTIQTDMEGFKGRAEKMGEELKQKAQQFSQQVGINGEKVGQTAAYTARKASKGIGDVIALIAKIFAYFILAIVLFTIVASLFAVGVTFIGFLPAKDYLLNDGMETVFVWGTLLLFIWAPIIGIITWIIRRIAKINTNSNVMRYSFVAIWILGWFCLIGLITSIKSDFQYRNNSVEEAVKLSNPLVKKLEVKLGKDAKYYGGNSWFKIEPFASFDEDTVFVRNVRIRITKATTDSFEVNMLRLSNGKSKAEANRLANKIDFTVTQADSSLLLGRGIAINEQEKFRNQRIILTIAVPVGKRIIIRENAGWRDNVHIGFSDHDDWNYRWDNYNEDNDWDTDVEYLMTERGLERIGKVNKLGKVVEPDTEEILEDLKRSKEELQRDLDENQRRLEQQLQEIDRQKRELMEKDTLNTPPPPPASKYKYQRTAMVNDNKTTNCQSKSAFSYNRLYLLETAI
ncbi:MAG: PspC domain-containing protein [Chitinophagaceae bacterium]